MTCYTVIGLQGADMNLAQAKTCLKKSLRRDVVYRFRNQPRVALTFDDGPDLTGHDEILRLLREHRATATFFLLGERVAENPSLVDEIAFEGHELAVHGWSHDDMPHQSSSDVATSCRKTVDAIVHSNPYRRPVWFRPPYGHCSKATTSAAASAGLRTALWSVDTRDWEAGRNPHGVVSAIKGSLDGGGIALFHSGVDNIEGVAMSLEWISDRGLGMSAMSEME